ncbi:hypothetical protein JTE90_001180, partial [Oedothorax gibbosus]
KPTKKAPKPALVHHDAHASATPGTETQARPEAKGRSPQLARCWPRERRGQGKRAEELREGGLLRREKSQSLLGGRSASFKCVWT